MSRILGGACCAVVVMLGLVLSAQMSAQEQSADPFGQFEKQNSRKTAGDRIEAALDKPLKAPLDYVDQPLSDILNILGEDFEIPIVFDNSALDEVAVSPQTEISINLRNITLRSALNLMLKQPGVEVLTYVIDQEVLLITTKDRANGILLVRVYRVDDFDLSIELPASDARVRTDYSTLIHVITSCIRHDSWAVNGSGEGEIALIKPGILVVSNTREPHQQLAELLEQLHRVNREIEMDSHAR